MLVYFLGPDEILAAAGAKGRGGNIEEDEDDYEDTIKVVELVSFLFIVLRQLRSIHTRGGSVWLVSRYRDEFTKIPRPFGRTVISHVSL